MEADWNKGTKSIWNETIEFPLRKPLPGNCSVECAVIGGGMAGILTAYVLKKQGIDVIVLEADQIASGQTKNTTAKITSQHGMIYDRLIKKAGAYRAKLYAIANEAAIDAYEEIVNEEKIECHIERLPSYLYTLDKRKEKSLEREAKAASSLGIQAHFIKQSGLPFGIAGGVCFENQAQFHPLEFIKSLSEKVTVYEKTRVLGVKNHVIHTDKGDVSARHIIFATHFPLINIPGLYFMRMHQERSYCLGLTGTQKLNGMYYSVDKDGLSLRWFEDTLLLGGGSHRTGKNSIGGEYRRLKAAAKKLWPDCQIKAQWSAQDCMSSDGIPYIGGYSILRPYWHVATGFHKWGMTSSMIAAMIIKDRICGLESPYKDLFTPQRFLVRAALKNQLTDMVESVKGLTKGAFHLPLKKEDLKPGHGGIIRNGLKPYACYKDEAGALHKLSARCPHLGCQLEWNPTEKSWDCPCHGSRFDCDGSLIDNPAKERLLQAKDSGS